MTELLNQKYNIQLEVLTPLSIGAGSESDWAKGVDYVVVENTLYHLNLHKMRQCGIDMNKLAAFWAKKDQESVLRIIGNQLPQVSDKVMEFPCNSDNDIKTFVTNQLSGRPLVPGSSLKGAIRSILFAHLRDADQMSDAAVFGSIKDGTDFMRFVRISDFEFEKTALVNTKIYNLFGQGDHWQGGWKHAFRDGTNTTFRQTGFNTVYECLMPHQTATGTIMLSETLWENMLRFAPKLVHPCLTKKKELFSHDEYEPIENLFYHISDHTYSYLKKEKAFFEKYSQGENAGEIIKSINGLMHITNDSIGDGRSCVFKMAAGSGFHSITGDWQYSSYDLGLNDRTHKKKYKSRKIAIRGNRFSLMGFVKLTLQ